MHVLKKGGDSLGALAMIIIDNPMLPGTGHRICNDCMKACVFQKQEPVNIPQTETGVLTDVLDLPWGFEIYGVPHALEPAQPPRARTRCPTTARTCWSSGWGPAGYTLAHHLVNEGFGVVGIDGLKIEPLRADLLGADAWPPRAVETFSEIESDLARRADLGRASAASPSTASPCAGTRTSSRRSTWRWRGGATFRAYGGVRFGGTLDVEDAFAMGFDHIAIAAGAGKPTIIDMKNNLIRGVRKASDFLMALQLTGGYKADSIANLQVRLPALVIGGGLTGIDTATELAAYYPVQVEKFLARWEALAADAGGEDALWKMYDVEEAAVAREFLEHGRAVRAERARAAAAGEAPNFQPLIDAWGGVSLVYRRSIKDSPAYRLNHEEITKFFEEGVRFIEKLSPLACVPDQYGALEAVVFENGAEAGGTVTLPARTPVRRRRDAAQHHLRARDAGRLRGRRQGQGVQELPRRARPRRRLQPGADARGAGRVLHVAEPRRQAGQLLRRQPPRLRRLGGEGHGVGQGRLSARRRAVPSPSYAHCAPKISRHAMRPGAFCAPSSTASYAPTVVRVDRLTPTIVEVVVRAPAAARKFEPGQFFRLQNYETSSPLVTVDHDVPGVSRLQMEGLALTGRLGRQGQGAAVDDRARDGRQLAAVRGAGPRASRWWSWARPARPPRSPTQESVVLCGGGLGNAVLFSIAKALREQGSRVLYFAAYRKKEDIYKVEEIEAGTDQVIWSVDGGELPERGGPRIASSAATSCRPWTPTRAASWARC